MRERVLESRSPMNERDVAMLGEVVDPPLEAIDDGLVRKVHGDRESIERIGQALAAREFVLHYQPKVNMRTGAVIGVEALIRWQHPQRGVLLPAAFLSECNDHRLAVDLSGWVVAEALAQVAAWRAAGLELPVSVNVGVRQLQEPCFARRLRELLAAQPTVRPGDLEVEVRETASREALNRVAQVIDECRAIGVGFSLDGFGTGYSSLSYLKHLPVGLIKIDKRCVRDIRDDPDELAFLKAILGLARDFNRRVIADGVETVEHGTMLLQLGCECAQGYGIARPMAAADVAQWTTCWRPDAAWSGLRRLDSDGLLLLSACVEYRAWLGALEKYLGDEQSAPPALDPCSCRFGAWLANARQARHGGDALFPAIEAVHRQLHARAAVLCDLRARGRKSEASARLAELSGLRDALIRQLRLLLQAE